MNTRPPSRRALGSQKEKVESTPRGRPTRWRAVHVQAAARSATLNARSARPRHSGGHWSPGRHPQLLRCARSAWRPDQCLGPPLVHEEDAGVPRSCVSVPARLRRKSSDVRYAAAQRLFDGAAPSVRSPVAMPKASGERKPGGGHPRPLEGCATWAQVLRERGRRPELRDRHQETGEGRNERGPRMRRAARPRGARFNLIPPNRPGVSGDRNGSVGETLGSFTWRLMCRATHRLDRRQPEERQRSIIPSIRCIDGTSVMGEHCARGRRGRDVRAPAVLQLAQDRRHEFVLVDAGHGQVIGRHRIDATRRGGLVPLARPSPWPRGSCSGCRARWGDDNIGVMKGRWGGSGARREGARPGIQRGWGRRGGDRGERGQVGRGGRFFQGGQDSKTAREGGRTGRGVTGGGGPAVYRRRGGGGEREGPRPNDGA